MGMAASDRGPAAERIPRPIYRTGSDAEETLETSWNRVRFHVGLECIECSETSCSVCHAYVAMVAQEQALGTDVFESSLSS